MKNIEELLKLCDSLKTLFPDYQNNPQYIHRYMQYAQNEGETTKEFLFNLYEKLNTAYDELDLLGMLAIHDQFQKGLVAFQEEL